MNLNEPTSCCEDMDTARFDALLRVIRRDDSTCTFHLIEPTQPSLASLRFCPWCGADLTTIAIKVAP